MAEEEMKEGEEGEEEQVNLSIPEFLLYECVEERGEIRCYV